VGWECTKLHQIIHFKQSAWLKPYIDMCMDKRKVATSEFEKAFWKLCCNAVYGRFLMNVRKHTDLHLVKSNKEYQKLVNHHPYKNSTKITDDLLAIHMNKTKVTLLQPIYVGIAILNLSK